MGLGSWTVLFVLFVTAAHAQTPSPVLFPVEGGAANVTGRCSPGATVNVAISVDTTTVSLPAAMCDDSGQFTADIANILVKVGSKISVTQTVGGQQSPAATFVVARDGPFGDEREDFEASGYVGVAIDNFAAQEIVNYLNPEANGVVHERSIFGLDFHYRLLASADRDHARQLWVYGETLHGARSEDLDCNAAPNVPSCKQKIADFVGNLPETALYMLRNATSLEAFAGLRYEFKNLNLPGRNPARLYAKGQLGFIEVSGSDGDAKAMHHVALGAGVVGGPRSGSYLEFGFGRTQLFVLNRNRRIKIDGHLQQSLGAGLSLFAQLFADIDGADGADAIQSYWGLSFDIAQVVGAIASAAK
jgi:hypothetical protein